MFIYPLFQTLHNPLTMSTFSTSLIIPGNLQVALDFYTAAFAPHTEVLSGPTSVSAGSFSSASIVIYGHKFILFNMGPEEKPSPAASFMITCHGGQEEIDSLWTGLTREGEEQRCGWVKDRFGFSWQIVPKELEECMHSGDQEVGQRVMQAMLGMKKLDIDGLKKAAKGQA